MAIAEIGGRFVFFFVDVWSFLELAGGIVSLLLLAPPPQATNSIAIHIST
jgi:hypothetical protein